jgi:hypothetical protein
VPAVARLFLGRQQSKREHEVKNLLSVARESTCLKFSAGDLMLDACLPFPSIRDVHTNGAARLAFHCKGRHTL